MDDKVEVIDGLNNNDMKSEETVTRLENSIDKQKIDQIMQSYKERLINVSSKNSLLYTSKIDNKKRFDLGRLININDAFIKMLYTREEKLATVTRDNFLKSTRDMTENEKLVNIELATEELIKLNKKWSSLVKESNDFKNDTGRHSIYIGYPFIEGKCTNKEIFRGPLFLFPVDIDTNNSKISIKQVTGADIIINRVLFLGLIKNSDIKIKDLDEYEVQSLDFDNLKDLKLDSIKDWLSLIGVDTVIGDSEKLENINKRDYVGNMGEYKITKRVVLGLYDPINSVYEDYQLLCDSKMNDNIYKLMGFSKVTGNMQESREYTPIYKEVELSNISELDSSQEAAVYKSTKSRNLVIYGPPGTGKSQVIANIISNGLAKGKRILMVSQKRAALEVVYNRIGTLNNNALMIHSNVNKRDFYDKVIKTIESNNTTSEDIDINKISYKIDTLIDRLDGVFQLLNSSGLSNSYKKCIDIYNKFTAKEKSELASVYIKNIDIFKNIQLNDLDRYVDNINKNSLLDKYTEIKYTMDNLESIVSIQGTTDIIINESIRLLEEYNKSLDIIKQYTDCYETEKTDTLERNQRLIESRNKNIDTNSSVIAELVKKIDIGEYTSIVDLFDRLKKLKYKVNSEYLTSYLALKELVDECEQLLGVDGLNYTNYEDLNSLINDFRHTVECNIEDAKLKYTNNESRATIDIGKLNEIQRINCNELVEFLNITREKLNDYSNKDFNKIVNNLDYSKTTMLDKLQNINKELQKIHDEDRYIKEEFSSTDLSYMEFLDTTEEEYVNKIISNGYKELIENSKVRKDGILGLFQSSANKQLVKTSLTEINNIKENAKGKYRIAVKMIETANINKRINADTDEIAKRKIESDKKSLLDSIQKVDSGIEEVNETIKWKELAVNKLGTLEELYKENTEIGKHISNSESVIISCDNILEKCIVAMEFDECNDKLKELESATEKIMATMNNILIDKGEIDKLRITDGKIQADLDDYYRIVNIRSNLNNMLGEGVVNSIIRLLVRDKDSIDKIKYAMINRLEVIGLIESVTATEELRKIIEFASENNISALELYSFLAFRLEDVINSHEAANKNVVGDMQTFDKIIKDINLLRQKKSDSIVSNINVSVNDNWRNNSEYSEFVECKRQATGRKKRQIRKFTSENWSLLRNMFPLWLMTPDNASKILPFQSDLFDMVIFDEASQMFIEYALPSIYRAKRVVIAGDDKQLKPDSTFNTRFNVDNEDIEDLAVMEEQSLLDLAKVYYDSVQLKFHYRSKKSELIDFSNYAFYGGTLRTAPNISKNTTDRPIEYIKVDDGLWDKNCNMTEAQRVIDLLENILKTKGNKTVGIITFNMSQCKSIQDTITKKISDGQCDEFSYLYTKEQNRVENDEDKSFFVKNIENVQGDERDIIIFSIGYAKNLDGKVNSSFGSLSTSGGENRLNVAVSRAKEKIYVVSSIYWHELKVENSKNIGPYLFQQYLKYAEAVSDNNKQLQTELLKSLCATGQTVTNDTKFDSPFEEQVYDSLVARGYEVDTQVGTLGYRIDLAVYDASLGRYLVGIECDGATYHSSKSARERDISRQTVLESKGWKIYRIWSRNWWKDSTRVLDDFDEYVKKLKGNYVDEIDTSILKEIECEDNFYAVSENPIVIEPPSVMYVDDTIIRIDKMREELRGVAYGNNEGVLQSVVEKPLSIKQINAMNASVITTSLYSIDTSDCSSFKPLSIKFEGDAEVTSIKYWKDILVYTIKYMLDIQSAKNPLMSSEKIIDLVESILNNISKSTMWISRDQFVFSQASEIPNYKVYIETKLSSKDCVTRALKICEALDFTDVKSIIVSIERK